ncbi:hypothetical protein DYB32_005713 [Aphanomyces invadans]|uniref:Uncharacterized protein n=1 Tax=Aphanomyces invadans TaxID=157072 RepID=A0A3R6VKJ8_9STRA|nr:hypothetical protein DYB32_005713 [Aphanomyces invadans]
MWCCTRKELLKPGNILTPTGKTGDYPDTNCDAQQRAFHQKRTSMNPVLKKNLILAGSLGTFAISVFAYTVSKLSKVLWFGIVSYVLTVFLCRTILMVLTRSK